MEPDPYPIQHEVLMTVMGLIFFVLPHILFPILLWAMKINKSGWTKKSTFVILGWQFALLLSPSLFVILVGALSFATRIFVINFQIALMSLYVNLIDLPHWIQSVLQLILLAPLYVSFLMIRGVWFFTIPVIIFGLLLAAILIKKAYNASLIKSLLIGVLLVTSIGLATASYTFFQAFILYPNFKLCTPYDLRPDFPTGRPVLFNTVCARLRPPSHPGSPFEKWSLLK